MKGMYIFKGKEFTDDFAIVFELLDFKVIRTPVYL